MSYHPTAPTTIKLIQHVSQQTLCALLLVLTCGSAAGEKWEWVHRNFRFDYYVDIDSIKRDGDKATAKTMTNAVCETPINGDYQKAHSTTEFTNEFDCNDGSRKNLSGAFKNKKRETVFESNTTSTTIQKITNGGAAAWASKVCGKNYASPVDDLKKSNLMPFSSNCVAVWHGRENNTDANARVTGEAYLDLSRLTKVNGRVQAWTRDVFEKQQFGTNGIGYTNREYKHLINCESREIASLEQYFFDADNKQVHFWKLAQTTPPNFVSIRPGTDGDTILELACKNANSTTIERPNAPSVAPKPRESTPQRDSTGTAFGVSKNQFITNAHVVDNCSSVTVGGVPTLVKAVDAKSDLALLSVTNSGDIAKLRAGRLRQGDAITVVDYPLNGILASGAQVTAGNVSALAGMGNDSRFIQISAPVQPGNSGGPVVDSSGNVVGVVVSKLNAIKMANLTGDIPQNVNFAISPLVLQAFLEANGVDYLTAPSTKNLSTADVSDVAKKYTSLVECFK